jgi:hypothetical protein
MCKADAGSSHSRWMTSQATRPLDLSCEEKEHVRCERRRVRALVKEVMEERQQLPAVGTLERVTKQLGEETKAEARRMLVLCARDGACMLLLCARDGACVLLLCARDGACVLLLCARDSACVLLLCARDSACELLHAGRARSSQLRLPMQVPMQVPTPQAVMRET